MENEIKFTEFKDLKKITKELGIIELCKLMDLIKDELGNRLNKDFIIFMTTKERKCKK